MECIIAGKFIPLQRYYFPGIDEHTYVGAAILTVMQMLSNVYAITLMIAFDSTVYVIFLNVAMVAEMVVTKIDALQQTLDAKRYRFIPNESKRMHIDMIKMHLKYNQWAYFH